MAFKAVAIWAAILLLAIANGALREALLIPKIGSPAGLVLSGLLLCALILAVACLSLPWLGARATAELIFVGSGHPGSLHVQGRQPVAAGAAGHGPRALDRRQGQGVVVHQEIRSWPAPDLRRQLFF